ncbi:hypothetical protein Mgra_00001600 [Meloidogyne graminicola]|uniref:Uncharacterized protein n=1 Tax=Meloidogyne graminicola TaxID=189291 RepID=A0A8S9ZZ69_9BILA|nr:hypothetical protein Mgra_00001600 [Meloidogyne graminicola]
MKSPNIKTNKINLLPNELLEDIFKAINTENNIWNNWKKEWCKYAANLMKTTKYIYEIVGKSFSARK